MKTFVQNYIGQAKEKLKNHIKIHNKKDCRPGLGVSYIHSMVGSCSHGSHFALWTNGFLEKAFPPENCLKVLTAVLPTFSLACIRTGGSNHPNKAS